MYMYLIVMTRPTEIGAKSSSETIVNMATSRRNNKEHEEHWRQAGRRNAGDGVSFVLN